MLDAIDIKIMQLLSDNGRMSNSEIARRLDISEATVRQRLKRLLESETLKISAQIDTKTFPEIFVVVVGIILNILPEECLDEVTSLPNVIFSFTVTGRYDIIAVFVVNSRKMLSEIIEKQLHSVHGVSHTETFVVLSNLGMHIDADKYCELLEMSQKAEEND